MVDRKGVPRHDRVGRDVQAARSRVGHKHRDERGIGQAMMGVEDCGAPEDRSDHGKVPLFQKGHKQTST
jgi:hypothetical protein